MGTQNSSSIVISFILFIIFGYAVMYLNISKGNDLVYIIDLGLFFFGFGLAIGHVLLSNATITAKRTVSFIALAASIGIILFIMYSGVSCTAGLVSIAVLAGLVIIVSAILVVLASIAPNTLELIMR